MGKYCPNCYDDLEKQILFNNEDDYDCLCCGAKLHYDFVMDEYVKKQDAEQEEQFLCPHCGSVLNDQTFFNKYDNTWQCTFCDTELEHSYCDAEYTVVEKTRDSNLTNDSEERIFECPNCGDVLNDQVLFDCNENYWTCTECGSKLYHDMYYDEFEFDNKNKEITKKCCEEENEYFCPNCNAILNKQKGFDPNKSTWTCKSCGELLMDDETYNGEDFEGVAWFCDKCDALLNEQPGFSDTYGSWICAKCKHRNSINIDSILDK